MIFKRTKGKNTQKDDNIEQDTDKYWWEGKYDFSEYAKDPVNTQGRPAKYPTPYDLWKACLSYFKWVSDHPLQEGRLIAYKGQGSCTNVPKMRAMTTLALCVHLGIHFETWSQIRRNRGVHFGEVCRAAENIIRIQKFEGAAADLLNRAIIARDLGLKDAHELSGPGGGPIKTQATNINLENLSEEEYMSLLAMMEKVEMQGEE